MKKALLLLPLLSSLAVVKLEPAQADVTWEHRGSLKIGTMAPVVSFSFKNEWSGQKHRATVAFDATKAFNSMAPSNTKPIKGEVQIIQRLDDDRLIITSDQAKSYIDEPYRSLKSRLRLNFWEALGSNLSPNDIPELTLAQRQRLGQEVRAVVSPFTRKVWRNYFRALPEKRVINGLNSRGYRFTSMINISSQSNSQEWVRLAAEWWLADEQAGDEEVRGFMQNAFQIQQETGGSTASMWINEMMPVLWETMPVETHQALDSMVGAVGSPHYGFQGTPMQFFVTLSPPPAARLEMGGDVRFSLELAKRDTSGVNPTVFDAPQGYQKVAIEPFLGMARNFLKMSRGQLDKMLAQ